MPTIEGGCLCGAVRYRSDAEPLMQVVCHCETCRKNSGSAFSMNVAVPQDTLRIESGSPRRYEDHSGASGKAFYRFFCGDCGSHVYSHGAAYGAIVFIKAGTLDDPSWRLCSPSGPTQVHDKHKSDRSILGPRDKGFSP